MTVQVDAGPTARGAAPERPRAGRRRQGLVALAVLLGVVVLDQGTKWWAWRHVYAVVNAGSTWFLGGTVSGWYSAELRGSMLDLASAEALALGTFLLLRRARPLRLLLPALLMIGGWGSNLLDRLGMHQLTAPGRVRGAVDFLPLGRFYYNVADVCIVVGTALFLTAAARELRRHERSAGPRPAPAGARPWRRAWRWALAAALLPALLGTAATLTAGGGHASVAEPSVARLLGG